MSIAIENARLIVGCSFLIFCIPALHLFIFLAIIGFTTLCIEFCGFASVAPTKFRIFVARLSASSAGFLISINIVLRFCKTVHFFIERSICFGLQRLELRYLFGILVIGVIMLNGETVQGAHCAIWNLVLQSFYRQYIPFLEFH